MRQGVGACGRVWGHVAGSEVVVEVSLQHRRRHVAGVGWCGRVWGHVAECGGMWQGWWQGSGYVVGGQAYGMDGDMWWG